MATSARERLAQLMDDRRVELRLRWEDVAAAGGISIKVLNDVRNGRSTPRRNTLRGVDVGLQWEPGSTERALNGGDPVPLNGHPAATPTPLGRRLMQRRRELSEAWADRHVFAAAHGVSYELVAELESGRSDFTDDQKRAFADAYGLPLATFGEALATGVLPDLDTEPTDPDLAKLIRRWPTLTPDQRHLIVVMSEADLTPKPAARYGTTG